MTTFSAFQEVIRQLCRSHKLLAHESGGTSFIPMSFDDEAPAAVADLKPTYVKLMNLTMTGRSETELLWDAQVRFLRGLDSAADQDAERELARDITLRVAMDFDARLRWEWEDRDEDSRCYFMTKIGEPSFVPVGLVDTNAIGWDMTLRFQTDRDVYDAAKWLD